MHPEWQRIANEFIQATSYGVGELEKGWASRYDFSKRPATYLRYEEAFVRIPLGKPDFPDSPNLWELLGSRRSKRNFLATPMTLNELNILLWGTQGITADMGDYQLRTTPSAGALYPIETYLLVNHVEGLEKGLYHLDVENWQLEGLRREDPAESAYLFTEEQEMTRRAAVNFVWTAVVDRTKDKYKERAYRYIWWDAGHVAQNLHVVANGLGLGVSTVGHWMDRDMNRYLGIDGVAHLSVLMASVGKIKGGDWLKDRRPE
ncbi:SagB/ThcOx family dehydrogenase [Brevibacillus choshinensis]|uniref:SagB/ThcOx family dehydrogenase n=1 Tax=Brevibacillus choshinensis TaxID=54911 RepID=A0ABX7FKY8_BRECH|nr:SagB/ThcOx family dehydrogenase [Brevibacillus choshinensis]QRG66314.1 SagB/ThcOx family dehydrogenase [Brevibacillus choshinensis]